MQPPRALASAELVPEDRVASFQRQAVSVDDSGPGAPKVAGNFATCRGYEDARAAGPIKFVRFKRALLRVVRFKDRVTGFN